MVRLVDRKEPSDGEEEDHSSSNELQTFDAPLSSSSASALLAFSSPRQKSKEGFALQGMYSPVSTKDVEQLDSSEEDYDEEQAERKEEDEDDHDDKGEENSCIPEVAAVVSNYDDPHIPCFTFRFWLMSLTSIFALSFVNQWFTLAPAPFSAKSAPFYLPTIRISLFDGYASSLRDAPMSVSALVIQLISYPAGRFLARVLPRQHFTTFGHTWTLNPGPFNVKEHVLIVIMAACGTGTAYAIDIVIIQRVFYGQDFGFLANLLLILTTQMVGYGMAGILRRYLVYPAAMIWPANLATVALFNALHRQEQDDNDVDIHGHGVGVARQSYRSQSSHGCKPWNRQKYFVAVTAASFIYYWLPAYIFPALAALTVLCWIRPTSIILSQITGSNGLGVGVISLDWNTIRAFLGSPLVTPWWAQANIIVGFVLTTWVLVPIAYYTNLWNAQLYPIMNAKLYTTTGELYDTMSILTPQRTLDIAKYTDYGPLRITTFFALGYGVGFATLTAILTHTLLYQRKQIWTTWKLSRGKADTSSDGAVGGRPAEVFDIHYRLMQAYREVPEWWYIALFVLMAVLSVLTCEVWDYGLPWWCVILSLAISIVFALPIGLIQAVTNMQPGLNIITEFVVGYILPGRPIANVVFKTYGYITMSHALIFVGDLKLGQYMKIAPRAMFWTQMMGTIIAGIVNLVTANWLLSTRPNVCTPEGSPWGCPGPNVFYSASVIWGVIAPDRMFGPTSIYHPVMYFFLLGAFLPVPFYFLGRLFPSNRYPILGSLISKIHIPVMLSGLGVMPPARGFHFTNWAAVGFIFQYWIRKYHRAWHQRFNYLTSAALDSGVALSALVIFFSLQMHDIQFPAWWGTTQVADRQCPLDKANFAGVIVAKKH